MTTETQRRAIGIVRKSPTKDIDKASSPEDQRDRIRVACKARDLDLIGFTDEVDVKGGTPLDKRTGKDGGIGLRQAVEQIEAGEAEVIVASEFDRLFRSLKVQGEVNERVAAAGGDVLALDFGEVTDDGDEGVWLNATLRGAFAEWFSRTTSTRVRRAHVRAVEDGRVPFPTIPTGYVKDDEGRAAVDPSAALVVVEAFAMRDRGATWKAIRDYMAEHGIEKTQRGVQALLANRFMLGELHFGALQNLTAHEAIVDPAVFDRCQRRKGDPGRPPKEERLLAKQKLLTCSGCGRPLSVNNLKVPLYRCSGMHDCPRRVVVSATAVEAIVVAEAKQALDGMAGVRTPNDNLSLARRAAADAQAILDKAIGAYSDAGLATEPSAIRELVALRENRDAARDRLEHIDVPADNEIVPLGEDFDGLSLDDQRRCIRAVFERVIVHPTRQGAQDVRARLEFVHHTFADTYGGQASTAPYHLR